MTKLSRAATTWRLLVGVAAVGAVAYSVSLYAAPGKKAQPAPKTEREVVAGKLAATANIGELRSSAPRAQQTPNGPSIPGGGVANAVFVTGFETTDSPAYAVGALATDGTTGQNGWHIWNASSTPPAPSGAEDNNSTVAAVVSAGLPQAPSSTQHIRIQNDPGLADNASVGVISALLAPSAVATSSLSMDLYIAASGDGQYNVRPRDTAGSDTVAANVVFAPMEMTVGAPLVTAGGNSIAVRTASSPDPLKPDICFLQGTPLNPNDLGMDCIADWDPGVYRCFEVSVQPPVGVTPAEIIYRYGIRDGSMICPTIHTNDQLVAADNVDSVHFRHNNLATGSGYMAVDNLAVNVKLIPGACCDGATCTPGITSNNCLLANNDTFLGPGTDCTGTPCANGRCCAADGTCSYGASGLCGGTFFGGLPADTCDVNCCNAPASGADDCADIISTPIIPVPGQKNFSGDTSSAIVTNTQDCPAIDLGTSPPSITTYWWETFKITSCARVEISYCCSGELAGNVRSPVGNFILREETGVSVGCPCDDATELISPDATSSGFSGTLPDKCEDGNFHMLFNILSPGIYYMPIFVNDISVGGSGVVDPHDYQLQIETFPCPTGGCCTGNLCSVKNVVECTNGGGNYIGDSVSCTLACGQGACCQAGAACAGSGASCLVNTDCVAPETCIGPLGSKTCQVTFGACSASALNTYFGGSLCADVTPCPPDNNKCANAFTLSDGTTAFTNVGARDSSIGATASDDMTASDICGTSPTGKDVWYNYTASCTGDVSISLCGFVPDYDSVISVYSDTTCPIDIDNPGSPTSRLVCNDDTDCNGGGVDAGSWSQVTFAATLGQQVKVRVGNWKPGAEEGAGEIIVTCTEPVGCPCTTAADCKNSLCADDNACNCATCPAGVCVFTCTTFGNTNCSGGVTLDDILCVLAGFGSFINCPNGDVSPCGGSGTITLDDILAVLAAFGGGNPCACQSGGTPALCGSNSP